MSASIAAAKLSVVSAEQRDICKRISETVPGLVLTAQQSGDGLIWDWAYHNISSLDTTDHGYASAAEAVAGFAVYQAKQIESAFKSLAAAHNQAQAAFKGLDRALSSLPLDI